MNGIYSWKVDDDGPSILSGLVVKLYHYCVVSLLAARRRVIMTQEMQVVKASDQCSRLIYLYVCLSVCLFVCLSVCLSVCHKPTLSIA